MAATVPAPRADGMRLAAAFLRTARPRQWVKNLLVFAAPASAGVLGHRDALLRTVFAFAVFCVAASGTYFINDAIDEAADRLHPRKRDRPVAAGLIGVRAALATGCALLAAATVATSLLGDWQVAAVVGAYALISVAYTLHLKDEPIIELAAVASGFILRALAGGLAAHVLISNWFVIVVSSCALFMVAGKRHAEHLDLGEERGSHRAALQMYDVGFLRYVRGTCSAVAISAYCLWAFERAGGGHASVAWFELSIVPFVLGLFRYALLVENGAGGAPEEIILGDRALQLLGVAWAVVFTVGVYVH